MQIHLQWKYIGPPPNNGVFADLREWVRDADVKALECLLRELVQRLRGKVLTNGDVVNMAEILWQFVQERQREEYEACRKAAAAGDYEEWLNGNPI